MDNRDRFPLDIPELKAPDPHPPSFWLRMIAIGGGAALFMIHTLGLLYHIEAQVSAITYSPENWKRVDMENWCVRVERANPGFDCPSPYMSDILAEQPHVPTN